MAEKLHSLLAFDPTLAMDRYMEKNKEEVRKRRKEVGTFRHKLQELRKRLNRFVCARMHVVVAARVCGVFKEMDINHCTLINFCLVNIHDEKA